MRRKKTNKRNIGEYSKIQLDIFNNFLLIPLPIILPKIVLETKYTSQIVLLPLYHC